MQVGIRFHNPCRQGLEKSVGCWRDSSVISGWMAVVGKELRGFRNSGAFPLIQKFDGATVAHTDWKCASPNRFDRGSRDNQPSDLHLEKRAESLNQPRGRKSS